VPIKTNPRVQSSDFFEKLSFANVEYETERDRGENPLVWYPEGVQPQHHEK
jgi:hypothetical protein